jgi:hypothetical protein
MNIFYLHNDPKTCAQMHNDKHCVKMILEYAQLLSTAHRILDGVPTVSVGPSGRRSTRYHLPDDRNDHLYSATHTNHPSAVWVRQTNTNYQWLFNLFEELMIEYTHRYSKVHKCSELQEALRHAPNNISIGDFTEPTPAMPDEYKVKGDSIASYRNYYLGSKYKMSRWTNQVMPWWFADGIYTLYSDTCYIEDKPKLNRTISMPFNHANL